MKMHSTRFLTKYAREMKTEAVGLMVFSATVLGIFLAFGGHHALFYPQCTTMYLHYNLQYRAGNEVVENTILNESLREMVGMFDRHPTWKYSIEIQSYAIERLLLEPESFPGILEMLQRQINRNQLELICGVYSSQLINAYPGDVLAESIRITKDLLSLAELARSRVMLFQEGQYAPGLTHWLDQGDWEGVDTVLVSHQQIYNFWPVNQAPADPQIPLFISRLGDKQHYLLRYDYLPRYEAGYYHGWMYWSDAELAIEYDKTPEGKPEFTVDPERLKNFEAHYRNLELLGTTFMTVQEWVEHCLKTGYVQELGHYQMSTHWGPTKYNTCFTWYGDNSGNVDDGAMLSNNYRGRNVLMATKILSAQYYDQLASVNQTLVNILFSQATRAMLLAMVTDTTGINPNPLEREYGYDNIRTTFLNCSEIVRIYLENIPALAGATQLQVDLKTGAISPSPSPLISYTSSPYDLAALEVGLPLQVKIQTTGGDPAVSIHNATFQGHNVIDFSVSFPAPYDWSKREISVSVDFVGDVNTIWYCPPLVEDLHVGVTRTDYTSQDILNLHIPLSNGLIYIPSATETGKGLAIIHNASQYHLAPRWQSGNLSYMTGKICIPAPYHFFLIPNTTIEQAKIVANMMNNHVSWIIGGNVTQMQGFSYLEDYFNSDRGDQWEQNEWW
jgi:hypothetical protein